VVPSSPIFQSSSQPKRLLATSEVLKGTNAELNEMVEQRRRTLADIDVRIAQGVAKLTDVQSKLAQLRGSIAVEA
jgi:hypothetical protein